MNLNELLFFITDYIRSIFKNVKKTGNPNKLYNIVNYPNFWITLIVAIGLSEYIRMGVFKMYFLLPILMLTIYKRYERGDWKHRYRLKKGKVYV